MAIYSSWSSKSGTAVAKSVSTYDVYKAVLQLSSATPLDMVLVVSSGPINDVFIEILLFGALSLMAGPAINVQMRTHFWIQRVYRIV